MKKSKKLLLVSLGIGLVFFSLNSEAGKGNESKKEEPPKKGNFALPASQQPGPLVGFGENIIDKHETQVFLVGDEFAGVNRYSLEAIPSILYGITSNLSIYFVAPYAASFKMAHQKSRGIEDPYVQLEYAFYSHSTKSYTNQATVVFNTTIPTGSIHKEPPTGIGASSFLVGTTFNHTGINWFAFGAPGAIITTAKNGTKFGDTYLYQFGFGRNIANRKGWMFAWMAEMDGFYSEHNRIEGVFDPNSGGNIVYITPSIWASNKNFVFQFGVGVPVVQHLFGDQTRSTYLLVGNIGWSFYG
jgi:hypothetical protein